mmetsp:Transcript_87616/g.183225  ORF Transcript_87616/g.183225 Transcript_87616/m.183225 type:complete len:208 (+) Transcript_87616:297-920(+)
MGDVILLQFLGFLCRLSLSLCLSFADVLLTLRVEGLLMPLRLRSVVSRSPLLLAESRFVCSQHLFPDLLGLLGCRMHLHEAGIFLLFPSRVLALDLHISTPLLVLAVYLHVARVDPLLQHLSPPRFAGGLESVFALAALDLPSDLLLSQKLFLAALPLGLSEPDVVLSLPSQHVLAAMKLWRWQSSRHGHRSCDAGLVVFCTDHVAR